jgi:hypothetical protein
MTANFRTEIYLVIDKLKQNQGEEPIFQTVESIFE